MKQTVWLRNHFYMSGGTFCYRLGMRAGNHVYSDIGRRTWVMRVIVGRGYGIFSEPTMGGAGASTFYVVRCTNNRLDFYMEYEIVYIERGGLGYSTKPYQAAVDYVRRMFAAMPPTEQGGAS